MKEAKSRGMRVWLLDDKYFPTGYANNYIQEHPVLRMTSLRLAYYDYVGPQTAMALLPEKLYADESFVSVVAYRRVENGNKLCQEGIELSSNIRNGLLWWDIPDGVWRVYYVIRTHRVCSPEKSVYTDMLSEESCKAMLHGVYEPHYEHFSEYFGNTFAGFFSDEPSFSNDVGNYRSMLGKEDMNTHQRLGYGAGHFFRALDGQDMAGIDIVLNQIIPGHLELEHTASVFGKVVEPEFFNYALAKLASSHSHIQPLKQNRAMCEIYGAFGWAEGIPMMKYLTDHMLVNGINYFVPHAFSPRPDDPDCPPHFYANGTNCQFPLFGTLMGYTARMAHILTDGIHRADVAVYYNAEAEWAGGAYMLEQKVCRVLTRSQIDFDFIPQDVLVNAACDHDRMVVHQESYQAVIIPYSQYLPARVITALGRLAEQGVPVIFVEKST